MCVYFSLFLVFFRSADEDIELPPFVDPEHLHSYFLNASGILAVKKVMNVISRMSPDIIFCPLLYPMSSIFLHYMSPEACYNCMQALLGVNKASMFFLTQSKTKTEASKYVLLDLAKKYTVRNLCACRSRHICSYICLRNY